MIIKPTNRYFSQFNDSDIKWINSWTDLLPKSDNLNSENGSEIIVQPTNTVKIHTDKFISIYCTILGSVILGLFVYVVFKFWKQNRFRKSNKALVMNKDLKINQKLMLESKQADSKPGEIKTKSKKVKWTKVEHYLLNQSVDCLPEEQFEAIVHSIADESSGKGWIDLAKFGGYSDEEIQTTQIYYDNRLDCIRNYLKKWSHKSTSNNLKQLMKSLQHIERPDTILLIRIYLKNVCRVENKSLNKSLNQPFGPEINNNNNMSSNMTYFSDSYGIPADNKC